MGDQLMTCSAWLFGAVLFGLMVYYGAVLLGLFKDSMMAHFRRYGEEYRIYPLQRFLLVLGLLMLVFSPVIANSMMGTSFVALALVVVLSSYLVSKTPRIQSYMPRWYDHLLSITTREERRMIATAWQRLPLKTRLRLNGDSYAFRVFVDEVRLTMIYGARDPDDPWKAWQ
jgi:hypothetical protein